MLKEAPESETDEEEDGKTQADALTVVNDSGYTFGDTHDDGRHLALA